MIGDKTANPKTCEEAPEAHLTQLVAPAYSGSEDAVLSMIF
jgi:hypothetical protein